MLTKVLSRCVLSSSRVSTKAVPIAFSARRVANQAPAAAGAANDDLELAPAVPTPPPPAQQQQQRQPQSQADPTSFYSLLRNSNFVKLGNLRRSPKPIVGKIVHVVDDDLYIEFGGKFKTVCQRPRSQGFKYRKGAEVVVALHDLEMTSRFLGAVRDTTLLEADATLLGLAFKYDAVDAAETAPETRQEEEEEAEIAFNLSDTLTYDLDRFFTDPDQLERPPREENVSEKKEEEEEEFQWEEEDNTDEKK